MEVVFLRSLIKDFKRIPATAVRRKIERAVKELQGVRKFAS